MDSQNLGFTIIVSFAIWLIIMYFIIKGAVKSALEDELIIYMKIQTKIMTHQAKQNGMSQEEIDKSWMSARDWDKKHRVKSESNATKGK